MLDEGDLDESLTDIEEVPGESAQATIERVFKGSGSEETEDTPAGDEAPEPGEEASGQGDAEDGAEPVKQSKKKGKKGEDDDDFDPELEPPPGLDAADTKLFNNLPKGLKRRFHRRIKQAEAMGTKNAQAAADYSRKWGSFERDMEPFIKQWAKWGRSLQSGVLELAQMQDKLTAPDLAIREEEFWKLAHRCKITQNLIATARGTGPAADGQGGGNNAGSDITRHPSYIELKEQNNQLQTRLERVESTVQQDGLSRRAAPIVEELRTVVDEKDPATGRLLYPALQDEAFLDSVKPLVFEKVRAAAERGERLSYAEAMREAYNDKMKFYFGASYRPVQSSLHASNGNSRAVSAARPLRGRPAPANTGSGDIQIPDDLPKDARSQLAYLFDR